MSLFLNKYHCGPCEVRWDDRWDCACNDRCPKCDAETEPYTSISLPDMPMPDPKKFKILIGSRILFGVRESTGRKYYLLTREELAQLEREIRIAKLKAWGFPFEQTAPPHRKILV